VVRGGGVGGHAAAAMAAGDGERAAVLAGAARGLRGGVAVVDPEVVGVERAARTALGARFDVVVARGEALGWDGVAALLDP